MPPPGGESLKDTLARTLPYYVQEILPCVLRGERTLVVAHGNSLRALIMVLEKLTPEGNPGARTRHRRSGDLPPQRRRHRRLEARSGGVSAADPEGGRRAACSHFQCTPTCPASQPSIACLRVMPQ